MNSVHHTISTDAAPKAAAARLAERLAAWREHHVAERPFVFFLSALVGVVAGIMAWLLKGAIGWLSTALTSGVSDKGLDWWLLVSPAVGVTAVVALRRYWLKGDIAQGVRVIRRKLAVRRPDIPSQVSYSPLLASAITLGFGGSAGAEGPIAFSGAAVGSNAGRMFGLSPRMVMILMGCGAGAGIAAIFKAPLGGALFTLEVLRMGLGSFGVMVLFVTTLIAALTATALQGFTLDMAMNEASGYDPAIIVWVLALGVFCGLYSIYYRYIMDLVGRLLGRLDNRWLRGAVSGLCLGVFLLLMPALYGEGYGVMRDVLNGNFAAITLGSPARADGVATMMWIAAAVLAVKCFATSLSFNGGGVTGEFAPTLFSGCFAGFLFAQGCNWLLGTALPVQQFALIGMAGVMAGAIKAPLMAMFIVVEMSSAFTLLLPIALASTLSWAVVSLRERNAAPD